MWSQWLIEGNLFCGHSVPLSLDKHPDWYGLSLVLIGILSFAKLSPKPVQLGAEGMF